MHPCRRMNRIILRVIIFFLLLLWCVGFANPVFLDNGHSQLLHLVLSPFYSPVCHQHLEKTITSSSGNFLVCSRCAGIYLGALIPAFIYLFIKEVKLFFLIPAVLIMLADIFLVNAGVYSYSKTVAISTGLFLGFTVFPYILSAIEKSLSENETK